MEKLEKRFLTFIEWFIILQPVIDFLTSIMVRFVDTPLTIGIVTRILFVGFIGIYFLFIYKDVHKKWLLGYYILTCVYGGINIGVNALNYGFGTVIENSKMFFKMYYFVYVLLFFYALYRKYGFTVKAKFLSIVFIEYAASIFISAITDTSFVTYEYGEGYCGWFYAGNEVGAVISILAAIALIYAISSKKLWLIAVIGFLTAFASVYIGTKVPFIACVGAMAALFVIYAVKFLTKKDKTDLKAFCSIVAILLVTVLLFQLNSPVKRNNSTMVGEHFDTHVTDKLEEPEDDTQLLGGIDNDSPFYKAFLMANWLLSDRLIMIAPAFDSFLRSELVQKGVGLGYVFTTANGSNFKNLIEMDFLALTINHGIIGSIIFLLPILYFAVICLKSFFKRFKQFFQMEKQLVCFYSILIALGCAFLAGHVFVAPSVSIYFAIVIIKAYSLLDKNSSVSEPQF